jgi:hypothetical protein
MVRTADLWWLTALPYLGEVPLSAKADLRFLCRERAGLTHSGHLTTISGEDARLKADGTYMPFPLRHRPPSVLTQMTNQTE